MFAQQLLHPLITFALYRAEITSGLVKIAARSQTEVAGLDRSSIRISVFGEIDPRLPFWVAPGLSLLNAYSMRRTLCSCCPSRSRTIVAQSSNGSALIQSAHSPCCALEFRVTRSGRSDRMRASVHSAMNQAYATRDPKRARRRFCRPIACLPQCFPARCVPTAGAELIVTERLKILLVDIDPRRVTL
jgi:hypothetical protein